MNTNSPLIFSDAKNLSPGEALLGDWPVPIGLRALPTPSCGKKREEEAPSWTATAPPSAPCFHFLPARAKQGPRLTLEGVSRSPYKQGAPLTTPFNQPRVGKGVCRPGARLRPPPRFQSRPRQQGCVLPAALSGGAGSQDGWLSCPMGETEARKSPGDKHHPAGRVEAGERASSSSRCTELGRENGEDSK